MSGLKRKPLPEELTAALRTHASALPSATGAPADPDRQGRGGEGGRPKAPPTVQINFSATEEFAALVAQEAEKAGSTRRFFARLMRDAGYDIPQADISPLDLRRRHRPPLT